MAYTKVAKTADIPTGTGKSFTVDSKPVALFNIDGTFYAIEDVCPHHGAPLGGGPLDGTIVACPWHFWQFDVTNGNFASTDAQGVASYPVKVEDDEILVDLTAG